MPVERVISSDKIFLLLERLDQGYSQFPVLESILILWALNSFQMSH